MTLSLIKVVKTGFEVSMDGDKYVVGSYTVRPNGDAVNSSIGRILS